MGFPKRRYKSKYRQNGSNTYVIYRFYNQEESKALRRIWDSADVELEIKDDLGNQYAGEGNGGTGTVAEPHKSSWSTTFQN